MCEVKIKVVLPSVQEVQYARVGAFLSILGKAVQFDAGQLPQGNWTPIPELSEDDNSRIRRHLRGALVQTVTTTDNALMHFVTYLRPRKSLYKDTEGFVKLELNTETHMDINPFSKVQKQVPKYQRSGLHWKGAYTIWRRVSATS